MFQNLSCKAKPKLKSIACDGCLKNADDVYASNTDVRLWGSGSNKSLQKHPKQKLHRSDMLMKSQINVMKRFSSMFGSLVDNLESHQELTSTTLQKMMNLDRILQHLKLVLQVLQKIQLEMNYWRSKLYILMKNQSNEAELVRQRILWLELRLEKIVVENTAEKLFNKFEISVLNQFMQKDFVNMFLGDKKLLPSAVVSRKKPVYFEITGEHQPETLELDEGEKYWLSDHHRFTYTPDIKNLLIENPLSYHNMGLAVPASYVDDRIFSEEKQSTLPWLTEQDPSKGNFDIMREDLEMLRSRIFQIHEKISNAAKLSANVNQPLAAPILQVSGAVSRESAVGLASDEEFKQDQRSLDFSPLPSKAASAAAPGSRRPLHYIDDVNILPITRTNFSKKYPHCCDHWSGARPDGVDQQPIIVNQRDLKNKTKLKLFVSKRLKKRKEDERDLITPASVSSNRSYRKGVATTRFIENLKSSDGAVLSDLQNNRLQDLMNTLLTSSRSDDREYAARSLSTLGPTASEKVIPALISALSDKESHVRYGAAKALINLGEWHESALKEFIGLLKTKNRDVHVDIMNTLTCSEAARTVIVNAEMNRELNVLCKILYKLASSSDEEISFHAAACLGEVCGTSDQSFAETIKTKLLQTVKTTSKWDWHSQALEVLVRRLHYFDDVVFKAAVTQLKHAIKWKDRLAAALLVACAGPNKVFQLMEETEAFEFFYPNLWDDPKREVRLGVSQAFTALGLRNRLLENLDQEITNSNPETRAHAVMAMSAVGIRSDKTLRSLIEMLGLDSSDYVRLQIMRTFHALSINDIRAVRALREREKSGGVLGREASKILASLDVRLTTAVTSVGNGRHSAGSRNEILLLNRTETDLSWFPSPWKSSRNNAATKQSKRRSGHGYTSSSFRSSTDFASSPRYEILSTTGKRKRRSAIHDRTGTADTHVSSISSFF